MAPRKSTKQYEVEEIVGKKTQRGKILYEVKWKNYTETTWEPEKNCASCPEAIEKFNKELKAISSRKVTLANGRTKKTVKPAVRKHQTPTLSVREARSHSRTVDIESDDDEIPDESPHVDVIDYDIDVPDFEMENGNDAVSVPNEDPETWIKAKYRAENEEVADITIACFDNKTPKGLWFKCFFDGVKEPKWEMTPYETVREYSSRLGMDYFLKRHQPTS